MNPSDRFAFYKIGQTTSIFTVTMLFRKKIIYLLTKEIQNSTIVVDRVHLQKFKIKTNLPITIYSIRFMEFTVESSLRPLVSKQNMTPDVNETSPHETQGTFLTHTKLKLPFAGNARAMSIHFGVENVGLLVKCTQTFSIFNDF